MFHLIGRQNLVLNMCLLDYLYFNFTKPRYYLKFWFFAANTKLWYGFTHPLSAELQKIYDKTVALERLAYTRFIRHHFKLIFKIHGYKYNNTSIRKKEYPKKYGIKVGVKHPYIVRVAASYKSKNGVRWFHSTRILLGPEKTLLHPFTAKFLKDPYAILALLNKPGQSFNKIQQFTKAISNWPQPHDLYEKSLDPFLLDKHKTLVDFLETNFVQRFKLLAEHNVVIGTYQAMKNKFGYNELETMQIRPDLISYWLYNKQYQFKGYLALDEKHKMESAKENGRHQVLNNITYEEYCSLSDNFENKLIQKRLYTTEISFILNELKKVASEKDFNQLLQLWAQNIHLFPGKWKPPLIIDKTFDESYLTPETIEKLRAGDLIIQQVSDKLYTLEVCIETGSFPKGALDYFGGCDIQQFFHKSL